MLGPAGLQSADDENCFACQLKRPILKETGVIAGSIALDPLGWMLMPWPNDGKTTVKGTMLPGMKDHLVLPASHDMLIFDPIAIYQTAYFLKHGQFRH